MSCHQPSRQLAHEIGGRAAVLARPSAHPAPAPGTSPSRTTALNNSSLLSKYKIQRAFADAGALGHVLQASGGVAALDEQLEGGAGELGGPGFLAAGPAGNRFHQRMIQ